MDEEIELESPVVACDVALKNYRDLLSCMKSGHQGLLERNKAQLEYHLFSSPQYPFWKMANIYKSVMPRAYLSSATYPFNEPTGGVKSAKLQSEMNALCKSVDAFCEEGLVRNKLLTELSERYRKRLCERFKLDANALTGDNLITEFRSVIRENQKSLVNAVVKKGRKKNKDLAVAYLLAVFKHIFPESSVSAGTQSLCYNLMLTAMKACAPDDKMAIHDKINTTLESRIRIQKKEKACFEYDPKTSMIFFTKEAHTAFADFPKLQELKNDN